MSLEDVLLTVFETLYLLCLFGLAIYGLNNLATTILYLRTRLPERRPALPESESEWPRVTVQLPIYNERYTVERLIHAVARLDYPRQRLQIQALDDSTDDTTQLVQRLVEQYRTQGVDITLIHRTDRRGFKAGALNEGLKTASGELIAIFDADFVPERDWLRRTVPEFQDPKLGCLQTRWGHLNNQYNSFTRAQALGIDGHFIVEQTARAYNRLFLNFNGTGGIWRRACIEDAGGWQSDTLTEDLDLSYRAQMRGWRLGYLPDVVVPGELPALVEAFKRQQFRWAKGSFQTVRKLVPELLRARLPWRVRLMGLVHITGYLVHPLMLLTLLLILPLGLYDSHFLRMFPWGGLAAFGPPLMYLCARSETAPRLRDRLSLLPLLILIGFGLSLNNTVAVLQGLFGRDRGTFARTPKFNLTNHQGFIGASMYSLPLGSMLLGELALLGYALLILILLPPRAGLGVIPWGMVYAAGYAYLIGMNLLQHLPTDRLRPMVAKL